MSEWIPFTVDSIVMFGLICFIAGNANYYIIRTELKPYSKKIREKYGYLWR